MMNTNTGISLFLYKDRLFVLTDCIQPPDPYSIFFEQNIIINPGEIALDIVTGSGFHAIMMASKAHRVIGVDIMKENVNCARKNVILNDLTDKVEIREGDLFSPLETDLKFDVIVAWPPVMPSPPQKERTDAIGIANEGGADGRRIIDKIIQMAPKYLNPNGRLQILHAWYNNVPKSLELMKSCGFEAKITAEKTFPIGHLSYERLDYLADLGFLPISVDGKQQQIHKVVTGWLCLNNE